MMRYLIKASLIGGATTFLVVPTILVAAVRLLGVGPKNASHRRSSEYLHFVRISFDRDLRARGCSHVGTSQTNRLGIVANLCVRWRCCGDHWRSVVDDQRHRLLGCC